jgi:hypothetical protein
MMVCKVDSVDSPPLAYSGCKPEIRRNLALLEAEAPHSLTIFFSGGAERRSSRPAIFNIQILNPHYHRSEK